jgi:hypothetical protein
MPESYIPIWMSLGEAHNLWEALGELDADRLTAIVSDAIEDERPRSHAEMEAERARQPEGGQ